MSAMGKHIKTVSEEYRKLRRVVPLGVLHSKAEYDKAVKTLDAVIDEVGEDENHPLVDLADALSVFIEDYEQRHVKIPMGSGVEVLKLLMQERGLRQSDLADIGSQGVVSEILKGKRKLNVRQIKKLAKRFNVSPAAFL